MKRDGGGMPKLQMNDRLRYYTTGLQAAWNSRNPLQQDACSEAWNVLYLRDGEWIDHTTTIGETEALVQFAKGWYWAADRFREAWFDIPVEKRRAGIEALWE
jgi:hypothetical protein